MKHDQRLREAPLFGGAPLKSDWRASEPLHEQQPVQKPVQKHEPDPRRQQQTDEVEWALKVKIPAGFGKWQGRSLGHVLKHDAAYLDYLRRIGVRKAECRQAVSILVLVYEDEIQAAVRKWDHLRR